jgi:hypothetical protein
METSSEPQVEELSRETLGFYLDAMHALERAEVPFLVGGAFAFGHYTGIARYTKDFDLFVRPADFDVALDAFTRAGWRTERSFPHWLGKAIRGEDFVDLIFSSGNGVARVDELWFDHAPVGEVLDHPVRLVPPEEMIWSKSFIMERERFDGADVIHLLFCRATDLDWQRLLGRFDANGAWRVLLAHLVLFGYVYPGETARIPAWAMDHLTGRLREGFGSPEADPRLCRGPVLSRSQYLIDLYRWGFRDARLQPEGNMSVEEVESWTVAAELDGDVTQYQALESVPGGPGR